MGVHGRPAPSCSRADTLCCCSRPRPLALQKAVRRRAYLQALGLRSLWRVNSPSDRHDPLELLTNDMPACDNGMRRAWSVSRLVQQREEAAKRGSTALPVARRPSLGSLHKDPSLGSLLLGEVAEVC